MKGFAAFAVAIVAVASLLIMTSAAHATFSGENGRIAFQRVFWRSDGSSARIPIFTIRPSGAKLRQVTHPPLGVETARVRWSPDGRWLAYMWTKLEPRRPHIRLIRTNGTDRRDLTHGHCPPASCSGEEDPAWSPDGDRIAFIRTVGGRQVVFVMRKNGTHRRQVVPDAGRYDDWAPTWSPQGHRLVFRRWDNVREAAAIFVARVHGAHVRRITPWALDPGNRPDWSPNGRWILFQRPNEKGQTRLCLIHPDGTGFRRITHSRLWRWGRFSPDGTLITALREPGETTQDDLYVLHLDGSGIKPVTGNVLDPGEPFAPAEGLPDWGTHR